MLNNFKTKLFRHLSNLPGWRTSRKIVVFESDDWGSIRMPSKKTFESLKSQGVDLLSGDSKRYNLNDTLASAGDLSALFETLQLVKDKTGRPAVFTPVSLVANPDFEKIKASGFKDYFFEPFTETLKRYGREDAFNLWREGIQQRLFVPQFHGREHLNVQVWLRDLQKKEKTTLLAFEHGMWGFKNQHPKKITYQAAFDLEFPEDYEYQKTVISEGLNLFGQLHGFQATFFVPPNGPFNSNLEETALEHGIRYISTSKIHNEPLGNGQFKKQYYWLGRKNTIGQVFLTRNAFFEPSQSGKDWVNHCLNEISVAFQWKKPAIVSTHRVNYIGAINPANRDQGLNQLKKLLETILKKWPDVEFMTSVELGDLITKRN